MLVIAEFPFLLILSFHFAKNPTRLVLKMLPSFQTLLTGFSIGESDKEEEHRGNGMTELLSFGVDCH